MDLYEKIKELASQKNVSIRQVEEKLGFSNGTIRQWGRKNPGVNKVKDVAKYFNVSVDYLLGIEDGKQPKFSSELNDAIENAEAYEGTPLTDQDKAILRGVISAYLENRDKNKG